MLESIFSYASNYDKFHVAINQVWYASCPQIAEMLKKSKHSCSTTFDYNKRVVLIFLNTKLDFKKTNK